MRLPLARRQTAVGVSGLPVIAPATWRDFMGVWRLEKACFGRDAWPLPDVLGALTWPGVVRLKTEAGGKLVAFAAADDQPAHGLAWITTIGVHPDYRRRGLAESLMHECERRLRAERIRLTVRAGNLPALRLYDKLGYKQVELWRKYYSGGEDGVVMEKRGNRFPRHLHPGQV